MMASEKNLNGGSQSMMANAQLWCQVQNNLEVLEVFHKKISDLVYGHLDGRYFQHRPVFACIESFTDLVSLTSDIWLLW